MRNEERDNQIGNQERKRAVRFTRGGSLENREQRQQNKNRASINDLALEMVAIRLMGAHARGRLSYALSLTSYARFVVRRVPACNEHKVRRAKESLGYGAGVALRRVNLEMAGGGETCNSTG